MTPCCLWASDDELETDASEYDCETCPVSERLEGLAPENRAAWRLYRQIATRLAADAHCGGEVLRRLTASVDDADWADLWLRLCLLYDVCCPPVSADGS